MARADNTMLCLRGVSKTFPGVKALDNVRLDLYPGQVTALVGENGAGKSTLVKTITGIYQPNSGEIYFGGKKVRLTSPQEARRLGITAIHQETILFDELSVGENIFVGHYPKKGISHHIDWNSLYQESSKVLRSIQAAINPRTRLRQLSIGQKHLVAIARALSLKAKVVILDEPTAALSHHEIQDLYVIIDKLRKDGKAILFISHKFDEIFAISDRYTVFRDGKHIRSGLMKDTNENELVRMMVARSIEEAYPKARPKVGEIIFEVIRLSHPTEFDDVSFSIRRGETLGLYGLVGSGRTEVMNAIFGITNYVSGEIRMGGKKLKIKSPRCAIRAGIAYVPEERQLQGTVLGLPIFQNISLPQINKLNPMGLLDREWEIELSRTFGDRLEINASSWSEKVVNLSGGNQQKVVIAKWLATKPRVIILDEPTKGIDIASKAAVHRFISELAQSGLAVVMISSELPEVVGMSDRILVMHEGRIVKELDKGSASPEHIISLATGGGV